jgi:phage tail-like protein
MSETNRASGQPWARLDTRTGWPLVDDPSRTVVTGWPLATSLTRGLAGGAQIALGTPGQRPIADAEPLGSFGGRRLPRGLAIGSDGRIYAADPVGRVILTALVSDGAGPRPDDAPPEWPFVPLWPVRPPPAHAPQDLDPPENPPADPYTLVRPVALALAPNGDLVIADAGQLNAGRVLVLTLPAGRVRHIIPLVEPVAVSFDALGRTCVADAGAGTIVRFETDWRRDPSYPHKSVPAIEGTTDIAHQVRKPAAGCPCTGPCHRVDAPDLPQPDLWIIAKGQVFALTRDGFGWSDGDFATPGKLTTAALSDDVTLAPPPLVMATDGTVSWPDPAYPARQTLPLKGLTADRSGHLPGTVIPLLARPRRIVLPRSGVAQFLPLDAEREGFTWDRITLTGDIPDRTRLLVSTATSDTALEEPRIALLPDAAWSPPLEIGPGDPPEVLVQSGPGRYFLLRIELFGDGARTPSIAAVDVFGPRRSSLTDLPAPFQEDPDSASFLDRFLSYFDTVFAEVKAQQATIPALFDPQAVPSGPFLDWLASWFDITFLPEWPDATRRQMVAQAIDMYRKRGTIAGLRQMVQWHTGLADPAPAILEHFRITTPIVIAGQALAPISPTHAFTIVLPATAAPDDTSRQRLQQVIAAAIPAHTRYDLRLVETGIAIGRQSTIGVDMLLGTIRPHPLGEAQLGGDTMFPPGRPPLLLVPEPGEPCSCQTT